MARARVYAVRLRSGRPCARPGVRVLSAEGVLSVAYCRCRVCVSCVVARGDKTPLEVLVGGWA